ncbi:MAG: serine/threonine-protein kinase [Myxococcaceae bacterium]
MPNSPTRDTVSGEALFILKNLRDNARLGRSNKLADVKTTLEPSVSLEFDSYFFFLRKFHYIAMDREAQLKLTDNGEKLVDSGVTSEFSEDVYEFFADQLGEPEVENTASGQEEIPMDEPGFNFPPPPPPMDTDGDEQLGTPPPPPVAAMSPPPPPKAAPLPPLPPPPSQNPRAGFASPPAPPVSPMAPSAPAAAAADKASNQASPAGGQAAKGADVDLRYVKFDAMGAGPLGTVFKGRHNALGIDICVKELKDIFGYFSFLQRGEVIKRLKKELCAQAQVRHPAVVAVLDQNTEVARPYFVMELLKGSLREKLDASGGKGLPVKQAVRIFLQLVYGLRTAHASGLTHHNVKPENVLFDIYGNAKIGDFGLSRVIEVDQSKGMPQVFVGTGGMAYMAPELISRTKDVGPSADVYGVGILFYEMLTGQIPGRRSPLPSEVNSEVPSKLDPIFDKMTQDRKESRYADFDTMLDEFYGAFSDGDYLVKGDLILSSEAPKA